MENSNFDSMMLHGGRGSWQPIGTIVSLAPTNVKEKCALW